MTLRCYIRSLFVKQMSLRYIMCTHVCVYIPLVVSSTQERYWVKNWCIWVHSDTGEEQSRSMFGKFSFCGNLTYIYIIIQIYTHTYTYTYICIHYITLHCIALHYIKFHPSIHPSIHPYIHTLHTYIHTYHTYIHTFHTYIHFIHTYIGYLYGKSPFSIGKSSSIIYK